MKTEKSSSSLEDQCNLSRHTKRESLEENPIKKIFISNIHKNQHQVHFVRSIKIRHGIPTKS